MTARAKKTDGEFLPLTREEMERRGWERLDVLLVTGDAYVDHPAFGAALIGRRLEAAGLRVGIVAQPRWETAAEVARLGRPRLFAGVTAGALDSMLAHYTAFRRRRRDDANTPGGRAGSRPNRASLVYTGLLKAAFPGLPVVLGGIEASLRRVSHYDFWEDKLRRSILLDSKADLLLYGMGERAALETAERLAAVAGAGEIDLRGPAGETARQALRRIAGTAFVVGADAPYPPAGERTLLLPAHEEILADPCRLMAATLALERQVREGDRWAEQAAGDRRVMVAPPAPPLSSAELSALYALPFTRRPHPSLRAPIPAVATIQFSIATHRGCGGGCSFCSLALHQGRRIASRTAASIVAEAERFADHPDFRGSITDVGGPTANFWGAVCENDPSRCRRVSCLWPELCPRLKPGQEELVELLRALGRVRGVKSVRVASGIRHDLALQSEGYIRALVAEFTGGQLKLAPEHSCDRVLRLMRKPAFESFERFLAVFERESRRAGKEQYVVPYLLSAFPGTTDADMAALAGWLRERGWKPQQVQCFIPTPGTVATAMFYAGIDPEGRPIPVARTDAERRRQHALLAPASTGSPRSRL